MASDLDLIVFEISDRPSVTVRWCVADGLERDVVNPVNLPISSLMIVAAKPGFNAGVIGKLFCHLGVIPEQMAETITGAIDREMT